MFVAFQQWISSPFRGVTEVFPGPAVNNAVEKALHGCGQTLLTTKFNGKDVIITINFLFEKYIIAPCGYRI